MLRLTLEQIIHEPGTVFTIMVALALGFVVSKKGNPIVQIGLLGLAVMHLLYEDATLLGKFWMWAIIFGFGVNRFGLHYGLLGLMNGIKARLQSAAKAGRPVRQETRYTDEPEHTYSRGNSDYRRGSRETEYRQRNAEYERRQQQREQEEEEEVTKRANEKKAAAKKERAEQSRKKSAPKSPPKQEEKKTSPPPPQKPPPPPKKRAWYEVLGVSSTASLSEIKKARNAKTKQFHPDAIQHMSEAFKKEAEEEQKEVNTAFTEGAEDAKKRS